MEFGIWGFRVWGFGVSAFKVERCVAWRLVLRAGWMEMRNPGVSRVLDGFVALESGLAARKGLCAVGLMLSGLKG